MNVLVYLAPLALALGGLGLAAFLWALRNGQFDDLEGAAWRAISDDDLPERDERGSNDGPAIEAPGHMSEHWEYDQ